MEVGHSDFNIPEFAPVQDDKKDLLKDEFDQPLERRLESSHW